MQLPKAIKDLALNQLKKTMLESGNREGRFFINDAGDLDAEMIAAPDYYVKASQVETKFLMAKELINMKNEEIEKLKNQLNEKN
jgi:hypothetical protein